MPLKTKVAVFASAEIRLPPRSTWTDLKARWTSRGGGDGLEIGEAKQRFSEVIRAAKEEPHWAFLAWRERKGGLAGFNSGAEPHLRGIGLNLEVPNRDQVGRYGPG